MYARYYWDYGDGRVYYFPDTEGTVYNLTGGIIYNNTRVLLDLPQNKKSLTIGLEPNSEAVNIIVSNRIATINGDHVNLSLTVWDRCWSRCT